MTDLFNPTLVIGMARVGERKLMKYMGSKNRIAKFIIPILQQYIDENNIKNYCEPFVGGGNVIDKIVAVKKNGSDTQEFLIEVFKNLDKINTLPEFVTKEHYSDVRTCYNNKLEIYPKWYIGAIGFLASYNGRFFDGGYAGLVKTKANTIRDYYKEAKQNLEAQIHNLVGINWSCLDYQQIPREVKNWMFYCDIPYKSTKQYGTSKNFNYPKFWQWVREMSEKNIVVVSECQAPEDMDCIWQQEVLRTVDNNKRVSSIEKLFIYTGGKK